MKSNRNNLIPAATLALLVCAATGFGCTKKETANTTGDVGGQTGASQQETNVTELKVEDLKAGNGKEATNGKSVTVHYTGWLTNGTKFDSSLDRGEPFRFQLGAGMVIAGWDKGVAGMKIGGKRKLTIPPAMGYGDRGAGNVIPPNSTLVFEVELLEVN